MTQAELEKRFGEICNKEHWKGEIHSVIDANKFNEYDRAVTYFTGGGLQILSKSKLKHGTDKFPEICRMMNDIVTDSRNQGEVVVVADLMNFDVASKSKFGVFVDNSAGILETDAGIVFTLDT